MLLAYQTRACLCSNNSLNTWWVPPVVDSTRGTRGALTRRGWPILLLGASHRLSVVPVTVRGAVVLAVCAPTAQTHVVQVSDCSFKSSLFNSFQQTTIVQPQVTCRLFFAVRKLCNANAFYFPLQPNYAIKQHLT